VTGASGLLGANFVVAAQQRYESLVAVYHQHVFHIPGVDTVQADLTNGVLINELVQFVRPQWIVHCAALTNVDWCEERLEETWQVNVEMSRNLAAAAQRAGAGIVYISTDSVFDGKVGNYSESDIPMPVNVYAKTKLAGEQAVQSEVKHSLLIRTNIYGWNAQEKLSLAEWILDQLETGQLIVSFYDVVFTPILVNDISEIILDMMEQQLDGLYHVAASEACSKYQFAVQLAGVFGLDEQLVRPASIADSMLHAPRPRNTSLRTDKVSKVLGKAMPDVKSGLRRLKALRDSGFVRRLKATK
jgi:dTDP-4-dehydrorhamnose reductase